MIKSLAVASLITAAVLAQSTPPSNPLIPAGISPGCSSFLQSLDVDPSFSCLANLVSVSSNFGSGSVSALTASLDSLCSASSCGANIFRTKLADFQAACSNELVTLPNQAVVKIYDALYTLKPLRDAVCLKNENGRYCVVESTVPSSSSSGSVASSSTGPAVASPAASQNTTVPARRDLPASLPSVHLEHDRRAPGDTQPYSPNEATWTQRNIAFLLLQPSLPANLLCTTCTRGILGAWIAFESEAPYAPGLAQSTLLSGQSELYNAVQSKCGSSFLSGAVQAAGGLASGGPFGQSSTSAARSVSGEKLSSFAVVLASLAVGLAAVI